MTAHDRSAGRQLPAHLIDETAEALAPDRLCSLVRLGQWRGDSQLIADEQRQGFEKDRRVTLDPPQLIADPVESVLEQVIDFAGGAAIEIFAQSVRNDRGLRRAGRRCQHVETSGQLLVEIEMMAWLHCRSPRQKFGSRSRSVLSLMP